MNAIHDLQGEIFYRSSAIERNKGHLITNRSLKSTKPFEREDDNFHFYRLIDLISIIRRYKNPYSSFFSLTTIVMSHLSQRKFKVFILITNR